MLPCCADSARRMYSRSKSSRASCRDICGPDRLAGHHDHQALDDISKLTDVAGPAIALKAGRRARIEPLRPAAVFVRELGHEMLREQRDIAWPVAQRRNRDRNDVQPE